MSGENVEIVRRYYEMSDQVLKELWSRPQSPRADQLGATTEVLSLVHPDVQWHSIIREEPFHGPSGIIAAVQDWLDAVEDWRMTVEDMSDVGDGRVLSTLLLSARGKGSGAQVEQRLFTVVTVREGRISRLADFTDRADALTEITADDEGEAR